MKIDIGNNQVITIDILNASLTSTLLDELVDAETGEALDHNDEAYCLAINHMEDTLLALACAGLIAESKELNDTIYSLVENLKD